LRRHIRSRHSSCALDRVLRIIVNTIPPILPDETLHSVRHVDAFALHYVLYVTRIIHLVAAAPANRRRVESIAVHL
jgi:hypothetical protein